MAKQCMSEQQFSFEPCTNSAMRLSCAQLCELYVCNSEALRAMVEYSSSLFGSPT